MKHKQSVDTTITPGIHAVEALLARAPHRVILLWVQAGALNARLSALCREAERLGLTVKRTALQQLDSMARGERHQGVVAECQPLAAADEPDLYQLLENAKQPPLLLILDSVQDPHNLGACLRSADAAGAMAVVAPKDKAAGLSATVLKVACGAAETVPFVAVTNLARCLRELKTQGVWIIGASMEGERTLFETDLTHPTALVLGAEGEGLRRLTRDCCDMLVHIPMVGSVASLNVSVAAGVCLFEAVRQRRL